MIIRSKTAANSSLGGWESLPVCLVDSLCLSQATEKSARRGRRVLAVGGFASEKDPPGGEEEETPNWCKGG